MLDKISSLSGNTRPTLSLIVLGIEPNTLCVPCKRLNPSIAWILVKIYVRTSINPNSLAQLVQWTFKNHTCLIPAAILSSFLFFSPATRLTFSQFQSLKVSFDWRFQSTSTKKNNRCYWKMNGRVSMKLLKMQYVQMLFYVITRVPLPDRMFWNLRALKSVDWRFLEYGFSGSKIVKCSVWFMNFVVSLESTKGEFVNRQILRLQKLPKVWSGSCSCCRREKPVSLCMCVMSVNRPTLSQF